MRLVEFPTVKGMKESVRLRETAEDSTCLEMTAEPRPSEYARGHALPLELDDLTTLVEEAAIEAISRMCQFRRQGDFWRASIYADLAAGRFQYLSVLLVRQTGEVYPQTSDSIAIK